MKRRKLKRIVATSEYQRCYEVGRKIITSHFILYCLNRADNNNLRYGITVTKKVGNAVKRNRVKRLVREAIEFLLKEKKYVGVDVVVVAKKGIDVTSLNFFQVLKELKNCLVEFEQK